MFFYLKRFFIQTFKNNLLRKKYLNSFIDANIFFIQTWSLYFNWINSSLIFLNENEAHMLNLNFGWLTSNTLRVRDTAAVLELLRVKKMFSSALPSSSSNTMCSAASAASAAAAAASRSLRASSIRLWRLPRNLTDCSANRKVTQVRISVQRGAGTCCSFWLHGVSSPDAHEWNSKFIFKTTSSVINHILSFSFLFIKCAFGSGTAARGA